jgi:hypothetical protein
MFPGRRRRCSGGLGGDGDDAPKVPGATAEIAETAETAIIKTARVERTFSSLQGYIELFASGQGYIELFPYIYKDPSHPTNPRLSTGLSFRVQLITTREDLNL